MATAADLVVSASATDHKRCVVARLLKDRIVVCAARPPRPGLELATRGPRLQDGITKLKTILEGEKNEVRKSDTNESWMRTGWSKATSRRLACCCSDRSGPSLT